MSRQDWLIIFESEVFDDVYGRIRMMKVDKGLQLWVGGQLVWKSYSLDNEKNPS